jgi:hypothetical protein
MLDDFMCNFSYEELDDKYLTNEEISDIINMQEREKEI